MGIIQLHTSAAAGDEIARLINLRADCTFFKKTSAQYKSMPWVSNPKFTTTELYVFPIGSSLRDNSAIWRVSMADVPESGPFSPLPAYNRIITLVQGKGFRSQMRAPAHPRAGCSSATPHAVRPRRKPRSRGSTPRPGPKPARRTYPK